MDKFKEYRARSYSSSSTELFKVHFGAKCRSYSDQTGSCFPSYNSWINDVTDVDFSAVDEPADTIICCKPRKYSTRNDLTQAFSGLNLSQNDNRCSSWMSSKESPPEAINWPEAAVSQRHSTPRRSSAKRHSKSGSKSIDCSAFSCLGQVSTSSQLGRRSSSSYCHEVVNKNQETEWYPAPSRVRTFSMPTQNKYSRYRKKLIAQRVRSYSAADSGFSTRHGSQCDELDPDDFIRVRSFSTSSKGIINRGDSLKRRRSNTMSRLVTDGVIVNQDVMAEFRARSSSVASSEKSSCSSTSSSPRYHRVVVLGAHNVGKTSIVKQFMTSEYIGNKECTAACDTSRCISVILNEEEAILEFNDHTVSEEDADVYPRGEAYIVVFSVVDKESFDDAIEVLYELRKQQILHQTSVILVGNKQDVVKQRTVSKEDCIKMALHYDVKYSETSALLNHKVDELLVGTLKQIKLKEKHLTKMRRHGVTAADGNVPYIVNDKNNVGCLQRGLFPGVIGKVLRQHRLFRSCDNLMVL